jgi:hypothetical protein
MVRRIHMLLPRPTKGRYIRVYAILAIYLLVCSLALTVKAFAVSSQNQLVSNPGCVMLIPHSQGHPQ